MTPWEVHGVSFINCNCDYACPCQFTARPTHGDCKASGTFRIDRGHHGDVSLDGVLFAIQYSWPGAVHEGNGTMQIYLDERMTEAQRAAVTAIATGQDTEEMATMWWIFGAMSPEKLEPRLARIEAEIDVPGRRGRVTVTGGFETSGRPIRNPVTGADHRVRIDQPNGFEYAIAEIGSGNTRSSGPIPINLDDTYGQFAELHLGPSGVIRDAA